jgi:hypothetical protein
MLRRVRTAWRLGRRQRPAAGLLILAGVLVGALAVLLAGSAAAEGVAWLDREMLVAAGLAAWTGGLGTRLMVRCVWPGHRGLRTGLWV